MSSLKPGLRFDLEWRITLFTLVMVPLMVSLGFWQLQRAQEKAHLAAAFEERQQQAPAPLSRLWDTDGRVISLFASAVDRQLFARQVLSSGQSGAARPVRL